MLTLFASVEARPSKDVKLAMSRAVKGYYQTLGVTARDEVELRNLIKDYLASDLQSQLAEISETWRPDWDGSDRDLIDVLGDLGKVGVWYASGRAWFGPEAESDQDDSEIDTRVQ
jgi:hypothetical protein